jgi:uncharacterized integral membrane protein
MRYVIGLPLLAILVLFALSNTEPVRLGFWPTGLALDLPLAIAVLGGMGIAFLLGGVFVWVGELGQRRRARRAEYTVRVLEEQLRELRGRRPDTAILPPTG